MSFPCYPKYKASGVEWLGDVPEYWDLKPLKYSTQIYTGNSLNESEKKLYESTDLESFPYISSKDIDLATHEVQYENGLSIPKENCDLKVAKNGTFLLCIEGGSAGRKVALLSYDVCFVNKLCCFSSRQNNKFLFYFAQSQNFKDKFGLSLTGLIGGVSTSLLKNFQIPTPSDQEQTAIAVFLDRETAKIDGLVAEQQWLMELLKEKRQGVISHAVTKGLNPHAPMKPSGFEWLGDVPVGWEVKPLKHSITKIEQGWSPQCGSEPAAENEWGVLKVGCVNGDRFDPNEQKALPFDTEPLTQYEIKSGDILVSRGNTLELVGSATYIGEVRPRLLLCDLLYRFQARQMLAESEYLVLVLRSLNLRFQIERDVTGTSPSMKKIGQGTLRKLIIALPQLDEQRMILSFIKVETTKFDTLAVEAQCAIDLLQERRIALISAAVTGQIDVRQQ